MIKPEESGLCPSCEAGRLEYKIENCYCHTSPPCSACVDAPLCCNKCGEVFDV